MTWIDWATLGLICFAFAYTALYGELVVWRHLEESFNGHAARDKLKTRTKMLINDDRSSKDCKQPKTTA